MMRRIFGKDSDEAMQSRLSVGIDVRQEKVKDDLLVFLGEVLDACNIK